MTTFDFDRFVQLVHDLPPELFCEIRDMALDALRNAPVPKSLLVDNTYKFPAQLHLDRASRAAYACSYFTNAQNRFRFACGDKLTLIKWIAALSPTHRNLLSPGSLRYVLDEGLSMHSSGAALSVQFWEHYHQDICCYSGPSLRMRMIDFSGYAVIVCSSAVDTEGNPVTAEYASTIGHHVDADETSQRCCKQLTRNREVGEYGYRSASEQSHDGWEFDSQSSEEDTEDELDTQGSRSGDDDSTEDEQNAIGGEDEDHDDEWWRVFGERF